MNNTKELEALKRIYNSSNALWEEKLEEDYLLIKEYLTNKD